MEVTVEKTELLKGLTHSITTKSTTMPILQYILLQAEKDRLVLKSTDLQIAMNYVVPAEVEMPGSVMIRTKKLIEIIKKVTGTVEILSENDHHTTIQAGRAKFRLLGLAPEEFPLTPEFPTVEFFQVPAEALLILIKRTAYAICSDDTRRHLSGALVENEDTLLRIVSTDGHRFSKAEEELPDAWTINKPIIVPKKGVLALQKLLAQANDDFPVAKVAVTDKALFAQIEPAILSVRLVDSRFPPYRKIIPSESSFDFDIERRDLIDTLRRISTVSEHENAVELHIETDKLSIKSESYDIGSGAEDLEINYQGKEHTIGVNASYLLNTLSCLDCETVCIEGNSSLDPIVVKPVFPKDHENAEDIDPSFLGIVMPLRL